MLTYTVDAQGQPRFERALPNGWTQVFTVSDGSAVYPRKVFLSEVRDPWDNTVTLGYDAGFAAGTRLLTIADALGRPTTLHYEDEGDPLRITKVTDPFGREAVFTYHPDGRLASIDQGGWRIDYLWGDTTGPEPALPARLTARRAQAQVRLIIDHWGREAAQ